MDKQRVEEKEAYETASYYLPRRLIEVIGITAVTGRYTSKSAALAAMIEHWIKTKPNDRAA